MENVLVKGHWVYNTTLKIVYTWNTGCYETDYVKMTFNKENCDNNVIACFNPLQEQSTIIFSYFPWNKFYTIALKIVCVVLLLVWSAISNQYTVPVAEKRELRWFSVEQQSVSALAHLSASEVICGDRIITTYSILRWHATPCTRHNLQLLRYNASSNTTLPLSHP